MDNSPIFIHSLYRSGSTYMFHVFRRSGHNYWCYQEPENEILIHLNGDADQLLLIGEAAMEMNRHPIMARPYFWEFLQMKERLAGLFRKSFSYDDFFIGDGSGLDAEQIKYFSTLISGAKGRPVLQFCRSAGRIGALKNAFGGHHIHLWREPRSQWWSFKVNDYFDAAILLIYNARSLPSVLEETKNICEICDYHADSVDRELENARDHPLSVRNNYFAFYALWLYTFIEVEKCSDTTISIDWLSVDKEYQNNVKMELEKLEIYEIDFSDCSIPIHAFVDEEIQFYNDIENDVLDIFLRHGYDKAVLDGVQRAHNISLNLREESNRNLMRDACRARSTAVRYIDQFAKEKHHVIRSEGQARHAETQAKEAELHALQSEARAEEANKRATKAEADASAYQMQAYRAEAAYEEAESRAVSALARVDAVEAENRELRMRIVDAESRIAELINSTSWRITSPLRWIKSLPQHVKEGAHVMLVKVKERIKRFIGFSVLHVRTRPRLKQCLLAVLNMFPGIKQQMIQSVNGFSKHQADQIDNKIGIVADIKELTPTARSIYTALKAGINAEHGVY